MLSKNFFYKIVIMEIVIVCGVKYIFYFWSKYIDIFILYVESGLNLGQKVKEDERVYFLLVVIIY